MTTVEMEGLPPQLAMALLPRLTMALLPRLTMALLPQPVATGYFAHL